MLNYFYRKKQVSENGFVSGTKHIFLKTEQIAKQRTIQITQKDIFHSVRFHKQGFDRLAEQQNKNSFPYATTIYEMSRKIPYKSLNNKENVIMYYQGGHNELVFFIDCESS